MSFKSALVVVAIMGCTIAAPKPITLEEVGRKIKSIGQQALPAFRGVCGFVNSYQGYPQVQGYPQGYPQTPQFPQYPNNYPRFIPSNVPAVSNYPFNNGGVPSVGAGEQDDLNNLASLSGNGIPQNVPLHIQDVFKNFEKLPKLDVSSINAIGNDGVQKQNNLE